MNPELTQEEIDLIKEALANKDKIPTVNPGETI
jgi:hypothetical protein